MLYLEYEIFKNKYLEIQNKYNDILLEKEELFSRTQPKAITYDKDKVQSCNFGNPLDDYVSAKEKKMIDERLSEARQLLDDRLHLLRIKEIELRQSRNKFDMVYVSAYIDGMKTYAISKTLNYSQSQVYRILGQIQSTIRKDATKCEKKCANIETEKI